MARADIMARLGLDRSEFKKSLDGAHAEAQGFEGSLRGVKQAIHAAFAVVAVKEFLETAKEIRRIQDAGGVKILDESQLSALDHASTKIDEIGAKLKGYVFGGIASFLQGFELVFAQIGAFTSMPERDEAGLQMGVIERWSKAGEIARKQVEADMRAEREREQAKELEKRQAAVKKTEDENKTLAATSPQEKLALAREREAEAARELSRLHKIINKDASVEMDIREAAARQQRAMLDVSRAEVEVDKEIAANQAKAAAANKDRTKSEKGGVDDESVRLARSRAELARLRRGDGIYLGGVSADSVAQMGGTIGRQLGIEMRSEQRRMQILENINTYIQREMVREGGAQLGG